MFTVAWIEGAAHLVWMFDFYKGVLCYGRSAKDHPLHGPPPPRGVVDWVPRGVEQDGAGQLRAAWVEAVATRPSYQGRGLGRAVMRRVADEIRDYDLGALTARVVPFYERLGWELWRGAVTIRTDGGHFRAPDEPLMILRVVDTPPLDLAGRLAIGGREGASSSAHFGHRRPAV